MSPNLKITGPCGIETQRLVLENHSDGTIVRLDDIFSNAKIKILTLKRDFNYKPDNINLKNNTNYSCNIETLRLINFWQRSKTCIIRTNDVMNHCVIEMLNLHRSVINLLIDIDLCKFNKNKRWIDAIETVLLKKYYHNLKNVNILIKIQKKNIIQLFNMLKKNVNILKYQFKKLNFGLIITYETIEYFTHTFEWNPEIDGKFLDLKEIELYHLFDQGEEDTLTDSQLENSAYDYDIHKENFDKFLNQWL